MRRTHPTTHPLQVNLQVAEDLHLLGELLCRCDETQLEETVERDEALLVGVRARGRARGSKG